MTNSLVVLLHLIPRVTRMVESMFDTSMRQARLPAVLFGSASHPVPCLLYSAPFARELSHMGGEIHEGIDRNRAVEQQSSARKVFSFACFSVCCVLQGVGERVTKSAK